MWHGLDPQLRRDLDTIREMVRKQHQTPLREWPLCYDEDSGSLLVVREWPDGGITAYLMSQSDLLRPK